MEKISAESLCANEKKTYTQIRRKRGSFCRVKGDLEIDGTPNWTSKNLRIKRNEAEIVS